MKRQGPHSALIAAARERADFLEAPIPNNLAAQESQGRALMMTDNRIFTRGSTMLRALADALESVAP
jgi:hypothetical protein